MKNKVTIYDVANRVGCSASTVSYALSGKRSISADVKTKILKVIAETGYVHKAGMSKKIKNVNTITLYLNGNINDEEPYIIDIISGIMDSFGDKKYQINMTNYMNYNAEALIIAANDRCIGFDYSKIKGDYVVIGKLKEGVKASSIDFNYSLGAYKVVKKYLKKGLKNICLALCNRKNEYINKSFYEAYVKAHSEMGVGTSKEHIVYLHDNHGAGFEKYKLLLREHINHHENEAILISGTIEDTIELLKAFGEDERMKTKHMAVLCMDSLLSKNQLFDLKDSFKNCSIISFNAYDLGLRTGNFLIKILENKSETKKSITKLIESKTI